MLSLWRGRECTGTFRLAIDEVPGLIEALRSGLDAAYTTSPERSLRSGHCYDSLGNLRDPLDARYGPIVDPIRNPYAPGAGQRPPELAGRDRELKQFEVTLERVAAGRPDRSMVLSGLRGVGKTVLLNALRSLAVQRAWGTGKIEARPDQSLRLPLAQARARRGPRGRPPAPRPRRVDAGHRRAQGLRPAHRAQGPQGQRAPGGSPRSTSRRPRAGPTPATSSST